MILAWASPFKVHQISAIIILARFESLPLYLEYKFNP